MEEEALSSTLEEVPAGETSEALVEEYSAGMVSLEEATELDVEMASVRVLEGTPVLRMTLEAS